VLALVVVAGLLVTLPVLFFRNPSEGGAVDSFAALWQVQATVAAIALPLLGFVMQVAGERGQTAARTHEVLTRRSWIFPIAVFALLGTCFIGFSALWIRGSVSIAVSYGWFVLSVVLALFAYYRSLACLFDPSLLRAEALALTKERMSRSLGMSVCRRRANNRLVEAIRDLNGEYMPFVGDADDWFVVPLDPEVTVIDVHLARVLGALRKLRPRDTAGPVGADDLAAPSSNADEHRLRLMILVGQQTRLLSREGLAVRRSAYAEFDEGRLSAAVRESFRTERSS
jgi:hypothetical protein